MNQVISPSQTKNWAFCPYYWRLSQDGWRPKRLGKKQLAAIAGIGFAAGMAAFHNGAPAADASTVAKATVEKQFHDLLAMGAAFDDADPDIYVTKATLAVEKTILFSPIPPMWTILDVERTLPDHGFARIDLGVDTGSGLAVADYKLKMSLQAKYHDSTLRSYVNDFKMLHYAWAYGEVMGRPVENYYIIMTILDPIFTVKLQPFLIHPEILQAWERSARAMWDAIHWHRVGEMPLWENPEHENKFGRCEFERACFDLRRDENLFFADYVNVKKEKRCGLFNGPFSDCKCPSHHQHDEGGSATCSFCMEYGGGAL